MRKLDLTGQKFGRLMVVSEALKIGNRTRWYCLCVCGNTTVVDGSNLRQGYTQSCGCFHLEITSARNGTHHQTQTRLFHIWMSMKARCQNPKNPSWKYYGGRGIKICSEWLSSFECFANWAKTHGYSDSLSIDRINVNGDYRPENCRWATNKLQARNKTDNVFYKGRCLADWCEELGISRRTVDRRIHRSHWPIEKALFTPVINQKRRTLEKTQN